MICYVLAMGKQQLGPHVVVGYGIKIFWPDLFITSPDHLDVTPVLTSLHWLPVSAHIDFKPFLPVFKVLNGLGPLYLIEPLKPHIPDRNLRSSNKNS